MSAPAPEPVRIEKVLKEHLDDLSENELRDFQWYVTSHRGTDCKSIPKSQLQNASRTETVDKLVSFHRESGAVEITVDILMNHMNHNDLATRLTQAIAGRNVEQQLYEPLSSAVRDTQKDSDLTITQDLTCSVCLDIFTEPVMLQCGHSFCRTCVHNKEKGKISPKCPLCNKVIQIDFKPQINYNLKSLSENYRRGRGGGHRNDVYQTPYRSITEKQEAFEKVKEFCDSSIEQIKSQRHDAKKKITDEFEKLHLFLKREEETSIAELEEEAKIGMMQKITELSRDTFSLSDTMKDLHDLGADNSLLQDFRTEMERAQNVLPDPQLLPQALINVSKHVENLQCRVLEKMLSNTKSSSKLILTVICPEQNLFLPHLGDEDESLPDFLPMIEEEEEIVRKTSSNIQLPCSLVRSNNTQNMLQRPSKLPSNITPFNPPPCRPEFPAPESQHEPPFKRKKKIDLNRPHEKDNKCLDDKPTP